MHALQTSGNCIRNVTSDQYAGVAAAYKEAGHEEKALDAYRRMLEIDPSNTSLQMTLGDRWHREGLLRRAHASFMAAGDEYSRQGKEEKALTAYMKAQSVQPDEHKTLAAITSKCVARGHAGDAIDILSESLSRNSNDAEMLRILGSTYLSAGRLDDAEIIFQRLLALDSSEYRNLLAVGEKYLEKGDLDRAVEQLDGFFDSLMANRNEQEAVNFLNKVLNCDPEHPASLRKLVQIFRRFREDFSLVPALKALSNAALRRGDHHEAVEALKELCSLEPHERAHREALHSLGVNSPVNPYTIYAIEEDYPWEYATSDIEIPTSVLSSAASRRGQTDGAMALLKSMIKKEPDNLGLRLALKKVYANAGLLELAANECLQIGRISQTGKRPFSLPSISLPVDPSGRCNDFEVFDSSNRRRTPRVSMRVPLIVISDTGGWREFTETVDVSEEGLRLKLANPVPPMTMLRVSLEMAKWPESVARIVAISATKGIVRYCRRLPRNSARYHQITRCPFFSATVIVA